MHRVNWVEDDSISFLPFHSGQQRSRCIDGEWMDNGGGLANGMLRLTVWLKAETMQILGVSQVFGQSEAVNGQGRYKGKV